MLKRFRKFRRDEGGNPTMEFIIFLPLFMFMFLMSFEAGYYMLRGVMLERGVDMAVRQVRLSNGAVPDYTLLKKQICSGAGMIPNCEDSLQVQMEQIPITPGGIASMNGPARCVDFDSTDDPSTGTTFDTGFQNELIVMRVCALMEPLFPTTGIGAGMKVDNAGNYAIVRTAAFVTEPGNRNVFTPSASSGSGSGSSTGTGG